MHPRTSLRLAALLAAACAATPVSAQPTTERFYLSGQGFGSEVPWEFRLKEGRGGGEAWRRLKVPSHWEQHGFGAYNYGHDDDKTADVGFYRHTFQVPESFCRGRRVELVFEGVMTDASVKLNGQSFPTHQGGFTRFAFEIGEALRCGGNNVLEVRVDEVSADDSVEEAERDADYWVFGGIYRPVYLRSRPRESIEHIALDAQADGSLRVFARLQGLSGDAELALALRPAQNGDFGEPLVRPVPVGGPSEVRLDVSYEGAETWSAEQPRLYVAELALRRGGDVLHREEVRFGFRTVELRNDGSQAGLYVNGRRTLLKGVNRHVFFPDSGRVSNPERDRADALRIRDLNLNAVRASHYPPDVAFLDACDELGLYVLDELPGWHHAYDTGIGRELVRELVERDVNHPSILFWNNGNEKGWNTALDGEFARHDPQARLVLHPQKLFSGVDTFHYPTWQELADLLEPRGFRAFFAGLFRGDQPPPLVLPTEFQHALYEGGGGAGLEDFWKLIRDSKRGLGGFLWAFTDEAIARSDQDGELDADGNHGPDGVLGPRRETSADAVALREVFSPVELLAPLPSPAGLDPRWDGRVLFANRYDHLDLDRATLIWQWLAAPGAEVERVTLPAEAEILPAESLTPDPDLGFGFQVLPATAPGERGEVSLPLPAGWRRAWALRLGVRDHAGREVAARVLPIAGLRQETLARVDAARPGSAPRLRRAGSSLIFTTANGAGFEVDSRNGEVVALLAAGRRTPWASAKSTSSLEAEPATRGWWPVEEPGRVGFDVMEQEPAALFRWRLFGNGWIRLAFQIEGAGQALPGLLLPIDDQRIRAWSWTGRGPTRVFKNRDVGILGRWARRRDDETPPAAGHSPKLSGYYGGVRHGRLEFSDGFALEIALEDPLYVGVGRPRFPADAENAVAATLAQPGLAFLAAISAIGNKFDPASALGPASVDVEAAGAYRGTIWLRPIADGADGGGAAGGGQ